MPATKHRRRTAGNILDAVLGDPVYVDGKRRVVQASCGAACTKLYCLTCRTLLANAPQAELHAESGVHVLASLCDLHGPEEGWRKP